ncbi:hypothetical protein RB195_019659 [Necator americanus]
MLRVWWGVHGINRFELLPDNTAVTAEVYCAQLKKEKDWPTRSAKRTRSSITFACCTVTCAFTPYLEPGPGLDRLPPPPIASASPESEALR